MKSMKLLVKGIVQKVGYRNTVYRAAKELGIKGYVKNLGDPEESVEILVQCPDPNLLPIFIEKISIIDSLIVVKEIHQTEMNANLYKKFEIIHGDAESENAERLDVAAYHLADLKQTTAAMRTDLGNKTDLLRMELGSKLDVTHTDLKGFNETTATDFKELDFKYGKISGQLESISDSLKKLVVIAENFTPHFKSNRAR